MISVATRSDIQKGFQFRFWVRLVDPRCHPLIFPCSSGFGDIRVEQHIFTYSTSSVNMTVPSSRPASHTTMITFSCCCFLPSIEEQVCGIWAKKLPASYSSEFEPGRQRWLQISTNIAWPPVKKHLQQSVQAAKPALKKLFRAGLNRVALWWRMHQRLLLQGHHHRYKFGTGQT
jgi:hypothetical protein